MKLVYGKRWLTPREIAAQNLIKGPRAKTAEGNYRFITRLIRTGKLEAKDVSGTDYQPYWLVSEDAIARYHDKEGIR